MKGAKRLTVPVVLKLRNTIDITPEEHRALSEIRSFRLPSSFLLRLNVASSLKGAAL